MTFPKLIRQSHRWLSLAFTIGFLVNATAIAMAGGEPVPGWIYLLVLVPLFALFGSGLYLFVAPYFARWRSSRMAG